MKLAHELFFREENRKHTSGRRAQESVSKMARLYQKIFEIRDQDEGITVAGIKQSTILQKS